MTTLNHDEDKAVDATKMLKKDHATVRALFEEYEAAQTASEKKSLVAQICSELTAHAQVEEEIFYPAVQRALQDHELVPEALIEHASLKVLIAQIQGQPPEGDLFNARVKVLSEYVKHHVKEEEGELFPKAQRTKLDMKVLGRTMAARKEVLLAVQGKASRFDAR